MTWFLTLAHAARSSRSRSGFELAEWEAIARRSTEVHLLGNGSVTLVHSPSEIFATRAEHFEGLSGNSW